MDLKRWNHIVALADQRSFVRAAEQVHLSQPALTRSIQAAETELGLRLFDRGTNEVVATPAGAFVVARARQLVFNGRCLERDVALYANRGLGDTAFGFGPYPAATFVPALLAGLRRDHPGVCLRVEVGNWQMLLRRLREEDIEFFVADTTGLPDEPGLQCRPLRQEPGSFHVRAGHALAARSSVPLAELWRHGVATVRLTERARTALAGLLGPGSPQALPVALECDNLALLKAVALDSDTVLAAPAAALGPELAAGTLVTLMVTGLPALYSSMGVVTLQGRTPSPMAALIIARLPGSAAPSKRGAARPRRRA